MKFENCVRITKVTGPHGSDSEEFLPMAGRRTIVTRSNGTAGPLNKCYSKKKKKRKVHSPELTSSSSKKSSPSNHHKSISMSSVVSKKQVEGLFPKPPSSRSSSSSSKSATVRNQSQKSILSRSFSVKSSLRNMSASFSSKRTTIADPSHEILSSNSSKDLSPPLDVHDSRSASYDEQKFSELVALARTMSCPPGLTPTYFCSADGSDFNHTSSNGHIRKMLHTSQSKECGLAIKLMKKGDWIATNLQWSQKMKDELAGRNILIFLGQDKVPDLYDKFLHTEGHLFKISTRLWFDVMKYNSNKKIDFNLRFHEF